jgi:hypothetical protein
VIAMPPFRFFDPWALAELAGLAGVPADAKNSASHPTLENAERQTHAAKVANSAKATLANLAGLAGVPPDHRVSTGSNAWQNGEQPAPAAKAAKPAKVAQTLAITPAAPSWRNLFVERAAIRGERLAWGELQNRWHMTHGKRVPTALCAGCRRPIGELRDREKSDISEKRAPLDLIDGNRVHDAAAHDCLIRYGERWRGAATRALVAMGLSAPAEDYDKTTKADPKKLRPGDAAKRRPRASVRLSSYSPRLASRKMI